MPRAADEPASSRTRPASARRRATLASLAAALLALAPCGPAAGAGLDASAPLREAVTVEGILRHLRALQDVASRNGGNRAAGTPGHDASAAYVAATLRAAGYAVETQAFEFPYFEETAPPSLTLDGAPGDVVGPAGLRALRFSGAGEVAAAPAEVDFAAPATANGSTSGCEPADFAGFPRGAIALMRRGTCTFQAKVGNATAAGAVGVVIANDGAPGRADAFPGGLAGPAAVPAVAVGHAAGERLRASAAAGAPVRLVVRARAGVRRTSNVLAETAAGDPGRVLVVGAHLDSVPEGPGINDNGSGVGVVLEIALQLARLGAAPAGRVRFAFWGGEELGLLGSRRHVDGLGAAGRGRIAAVLNLDMVGSPNHGRFVHDGDGSAGGRAGPGGSAAIERVLADYFRARGLPVEATPLEGRSDYGPFMAAGVAVGGLYAGGPERKTAAQARLFGGAAGEPFDPCYHRGCDTLANVGARALDELGDAAAHAVLALMLDPALGAAAGRGGPRA